MGGNYNMGGNDLIYTCNNNGRWAWGVFLQMNDQIIVRFVVWKLIKPARINWLTQCREWRWETKVQTCKDKNAWDLLSFVKYIFLELLFKLAATQTSAQVVSAWSNELTSPSSTSPTSNSSDFKWKLCIDRADFSSKTTVMLPKPLLLQPCSWWALTSVQHSLNLGSESDRNSHFCRWQIGFHHTWRPERQTGARSRLQLMSAGKARGPIYQLNPSTDPFVSLHTCSMDSWGLCMCWDEEHPQLGMKTNLNICTPPGLTPCPKRDNASSTHEQFYFLRTFLADGEGKGGRGTEGREKIQLLTLSWTEEQRSAVISSQ